MQPTKTASREDWLAARKALLARERELTRLRDEVNAERRALPWVRLEKDYRFADLSGERSLADLFDGRPQLAVYHFMLAPEHDHICKGCAFLADHVDAARQHFEQAGLSFAAVSRAAPQRIAEVKQRLGWRFAWVSSGESDFNYDLGVSFTPEQVAAGTCGYNYATTPYSARDLHGVSIFVRDEAGVIYHSYSTYARGAELLAGAFTWLDLTPLGRNEQGTMSWVRLHDEYEGQTAAEDSCCRTQTPAASTL